MDKYDVIIIGAGLAGLQCARLLASRGVKVLLVDRRRTIDQSIRTTGIFVRRTLEDFDIPQDCLGPPIRHVTLYSPSRRQMEISSDHDEFQIGRMARLYQRYLDQCLRAGVEWMPDARYVEHSVVRDRLLVRLDSRSFYRLIQARYLIGADGANSCVAHDLKLDRNREFIVGVEDLWSDVPLDGPPRLHCFIDPKLAPGYIAWVAHDGEETHIGVGGSPSKFEPLQALDRFRESLVPILDFTKARRIERRGGRIPVGGILKNIANEHGLLIGDAAGAVSPLTAGGLDPCMRLSSLAAEVTAKYLETRDAQVLKAYSGEPFRARFTSRLWMRRLVSTVRHPMIVELVCAGFRMPLLNGFAWHVFFGRGSFPDVAAELAPRPLVAVR